MVAPAAGGRSRAAGARALVVYARPPVAGAVKKRLLPAFTPGQAVLLYEAMLCDTLERMAEAAGESASLFVSWSEACEPGGELAGLLPPWRSELQRGGDLGERMAATLQEKLHGGFEAVVLVGADAPGLPLSYVRRGFEELAAHDVVLGPCEDGGYYLLGSRRLHPRLFQNVPWGTSQVLSVTRDRLRNERIPWHELPVWRDVDTPEDVARLWNEMQRLRSKGVSDLPRRTFDALAAIAPGPRRPPTG